MSLQETYTLVNGVKIPKVGFGTWQTPDGDVAETAVLQALEAGYRHIDTAQGYHNEESVGRGIKKSGIPREEIFITTKLWNGYHTYEACKKTFYESLEKLQTDYVDLFLIHWPNPIAFRDHWEEANAETWRAMEELYEEGKIKAIGVSNFHIHHLEDLLETAKIVPAVDQIELHPTLSQEKLSTWLKAHDIAVESWGPLGQGSDLKNPVIVEIGEKYNKSSAQVILKWHLQHGFIVIPKSSHKERIAENLNVFDFSLSDEDMEALDKLNTNDRQGTNPDTYDTK